MEEQIFKLLRENRIGHAKAHYLKHELISIFKAEQRLREPKLICNHSQGIESCDYKFKDVYSCKVLRNCDVCGN